jgi:hypothetical protein
MRIFFLFLTIVGLNLSLQAQPLAEGWGSTLIGFWKVTEMDTAKIPDDVPLYVEVTEKEFLMFNGAKVQPAEWKIDEEKRQLLLRSNRGIEEWDILHFDSERLEIYDAATQSKMAFKRFEGPKGTKPQNQVKANISDILGNWLFVSANGQQVPEAELELNFDITGLLQLKSRNKLDSIVWQLNASKTQLMVGLPNEAPESWRLTSLEANSISFMEKGTELRFTRYFEPLTASREPLLHGKWQIIEVGGVPAGDGTSKKSMEFNADGHLYFYTDQEKTAEGSWGLTEAKNAVFVVTVAGEEKWNLLAIGARYLVLEMGELKMLLIKN